MANPMAMMTLNARGAPYWCNTWGTLCGHVWRIFFLSLRRVQVVQQLRSWWSLARLWWHPISWWLVRPHRWCGTWRVCGVGLAFALLPPSLLFLLFKHSKLKIINNLLNLTR
jgi:hypothetical protein